MMGEREGTLLRDLLVTTKDGDWGKEKPETGYVPYHIIRGTDFPAVRVGDLSSVPERYLPERTADRRTLESDDILIETAGGTRDRPTGRTLLITKAILSHFRGPVTCASFARFLRVDRAQADPRFVFWYLQHLYENGEMSQHQVQHTGVARFQYTRFAETQNVPLPSLTKQQAIADVLGTLDDKIELNRRMNATLEAMAHALFQSWFVDFDPVRAKLDSRQPPRLDPITAALFPEHFEESSIGKTPVGWEVAALETTLAVLETGGRPKGGVGGITGGVPSIGAESIVGIGQFDFNKTKFVPAAFFNNMKKGHIQSHDVLLYKDGGRPGEYEPHVSMFGNGFPFENCGINEHVYRLRANGRLSQEYLYFWLTSELALAEMRIKGTGVAIPGLNSTAVRSLAVLVPPHLVVEAFTRHATPLVTRIFANARQSRTLSTMRDTLLPKLLSGELSVAEMEKEVSA